MQIITNTTFLGSKALGKESLSIDNATITNVAHLARLSISEEMIAPVTEKLTTIINLINEMQEVDTDSVEPLYHSLDGQQYLRTDEISETNQREQLMAAAPATEDGLFLVPRVIE